MADRRYFSPAHASRGADRPRVKQVLRPPRFRCSARSRISRRAILGSGLSPAASGASPDSPCGDLGSTLRARVCSRGANFAP